MGWAKTLVLYCDTDICDEEIVLEGTEATKAKVIKFARSQGWKIGVDGRATCQECNYIGKDIADV